MDSNEKGLIFLGKRLIKEVGEDDISGLSAELAYRFFLALFPFFIFLTAAGGFVADYANVQNPAGEVMDWLGDALPEDASSVLRTQIEEVTASKSGALLSFGIIAAVWAASSGISNLIKGMNRVYEVKEQRPIVKRYALSIGLTLLGGISIIAAFLLLVGGQVAGMEIAEQVGLEGAAATVFTLARWPIVIVIIMIAVAFVYWAAPNVDVPFRWISPGAIVFTIGWLVASYLFGLYVSNFASYNATYGALGAIVILLFWFYLTAFTLMLGVEINAVLAQEVAPAEVRQALPEESREHAERPDAGPGEARLSAPRSGSRDAAPAARRATPPATATEERRSRFSGVASRAAPALGLAVAALTLWKVARGESAGA
jgi:membrane protein